MTPEGSVASGWSRRARELAVAGAARNGEDAIREAASLRWCRAGSRLTRLPSHPGDRTPATQLFAQVRAPRVRRCRRPLTRGAAQLSADCRTLDWGESPSGAKPRAMTRRLPLEQARLPTFRAHVEHALRALAGRPSHPRPGERRSLRPGCARDVPLHPDAHRCDAVASCTLLR